MASPRSRGLLSEQFVAAFDFTGLTNGEVIDFRITFGDNVSGNNRIHRVDNIVVNGDVVTIPEPSAALLGGLGLLALVRRKR